MACTDVARIYIVVVEIFIAQGAVGIADQAVFFDGGGVEFDLDFDILRYGGECGGQLLLQDFFSLLFSLSM